MAGQNSFVLRVTAPTIVVPTFNGQQLRAIGAAAIHQMQERLDRYQNVFDLPAKPYSAKGPVYIPISGRGTMTRKLGAGPGGRQRGVVSVDPLAGTITLRRNKTNLGGREVLTSKDVRAMQASGRVHIIGANRRDSSRGGARPGQIVAGHTGKTLKFANWGDYKRALGRSGQRDLYLSGKMRGAVSVVAVTKTSVTIAFTRESEHKKALGNQRIDPWFGLSPRDYAMVIAYAESLLPGASGSMVA